MYALADTSGRPSARTVRSAVGTGAPDSNAAPPDLRAVARRVRRAQHQPVAATAQLLALDPRPDLQRDPAGADAVPRDLRERAPLAVPALLHAQRQSRLLGERQPK